MIHIRLGEPQDRNALFDVDLVAHKEQGRRDFIINAINDKTCYVAELDKLVVGYGVLTYTFYHCGFVDMLYVHKDFRRRGVGTALMNHLEAICRTGKLFTSTNLSNLAMQSLLTKLGYVVSGVIHNLDEGDPEIVYLKRRRGSG